MILHMSETQQQQGVSGVCVGAIVLGTMSIVLLLTIGILPTEFAIFTAAGAMILGIIGGYIADRSGLAGVWLARTGVILGIIATIAAGWSLSQ
jgi:hypothetical protein